MAVKGGVGGIGGDEAEVLQIIYCQVVPAGKVDVGVHREATALMWNVLLFPLQISPAGNSQTFASRGVATFTVTFFCADAVQVHPQFGGQVFGSEASLGS